MEGWQRGQATDSDVEVDVDVDVAADADTNSVAVVVVCPVRCATYIKYASKIDDDAFLTIRGAFYVVH